MRGIQDISPMDAAPKQMGCNTQAADLLLMAAAPSQANFGDKVVARGKSPVSTSLSGSALRARSGISDRKTPLEKANQLVSGVTEGPAFRPGRSCSAPPDRPKWTQTLTSVWLSPFAPLGRTIRRHATVQETAITIPAADPALPRKTRSS